MLVLYCQTCCKGCMTYRKWIDHLFSPVHQKRTKGVIKGWSKKHRNRAVIFTELSKPYEEIQEDVIRKLAWLVSEYTIISDVYFNCSEKMCIILIDEKKGADFIVKLDDITSGNYCPYKRLSIEVPSVEWDNFLKAGNELAATNMLRDAETYQNANKVEQPIEVIDLVNYESPSDTEENGSIRDAENVSDIEVNHSENEDDAEEENSDTEKRNNCTEEENENSDIEEKNDGTDEENKDVEEENDDADENGSEVENDEGEKESDSNDGMADGDYEMNNVDDTCPYPDKDEKRLNRDFKDFMMNISLSNKEVRKRKRIFAQLRCVLKGKGYKTATLYFFETGIGKLNFLRTTPVCIGVDIDDYFKQKGCSPKVVPKRITDNMQDVLESSQLNRRPFCENLYKDVFQREFALNFTHKETNLKVQCFFYLKMMQQKLLTVSIYMRCDPRIPPLVKFLVTWYEKCVQDLQPATSESKFCIYYPFIQLIIFFLVHKGVLPTVDRFRKTKESHLIIKLKTVGITQNVNRVMKNFKTNCPYSKRLDMDPATKRPSAKCILTLAKEFLQYFGEVDLESNVVSLPLGKLVDKSTLMESSMHYSEKSELAKFYRMLIKKSKPVSFIIQDVCDGLPYDFSKRWFSNSLSEFQKSCQNSAVEIRNILCGRSSISNLCHYFPSQVKHLVPSENVEFSSKSDFVIHTAHWLSPNIKRRLKSTEIHKGKFWFCIMKDFFDEVVQSVLKCTIKGTTVDNQIEHEMLENRKNKRNLSETDDESVLPSKRLKKNNGEPISQASDAVANVNRSLVLPYGGTYVKEYFVQSQYLQAFSLKSRKKVKPPLSKLNDDPLLVEEQISNSIIMNFAHAADKSVDLTFKVLIDCRTLAGGIQIEAPRDQNPIDTAILEDILTFVVDLARKYASYRLNKFMVDHGCK